MSYHSRKALEVLEMNDNLGRGATENDIEKYWGEGGELRHMCGSWNCDEDCSKCEIYIDDLEDEE